MDVEIAMGKEAELQSWRMRLLAEARQREYMISRDETVYGAPKVGHMQVTMLTDHYLKLAEFALAHIEHELDKIYRPQGVEND